MIDDILKESLGATSRYKVSGYDVRKSESQNEDRQFPPGHKAVETYLGGWDMPTGDSGKLSTRIYEQVLQAIHATAATDAGQQYQECTDPPYNALAGNDGKGVVDDVVDILKHPDGVQLLFFNGIHDMICNHVGNERYLEKLPWDHTDAWILADRFAWVAATEVPGQVSGYMKEYMNLKFLKVLDAGHMVPMDVPSVALDMIKLFVYKGSFQTSKQSLSKAKDDNGACPICPTCVNRDSSSTIPSESSADTDARMSTYIISYAWLAAGAALLAIFLATVIMRKRGTDRVRAVMVPQYDLELRASSYRDDNDDDHDANENGVVVT